MQNVKLIFDIAIGIFIIVITSYIPSPMPVGLFWPALLVTIPSLLIGRYGKIRFKWFALGTVLGAITIIILKISQWESMALMYSVLQVIPVFASLISFFFGWIIYAPIKARQKSNDL